MRFCLYSETIRAFRAMLGSSAVPATSGIPGLCEVWKSGRELIDRGGALLGLLSDLAAGVDCVGNAGRFPETGLGGGGFVRRAAAATG